MRLQCPPPRNFFWEQRRGPQLPRAACRSSLRAVAELHEDGVVHGSLGLGSLALGGDRVKLDFLGFAKPATAEGQLEDLRSLGLALFEFTFEYFSEKQNDIEYLRRLYEDVFQYDAQSFADYAASVDPRWRSSVDFLRANQNEGFDFFRSLLSAPSSKAKAKASEEKKTPPPELAKLFDELAEESTARTLLDTSPFLSSSLEGEEKRALADLRSRLLQQSRNL
mmetsp:Transcript_13504/g.43983  ORF Transcript_13504/g.43983 Transcript_13504/m.43983 type:complete len:223 (-) Transcript_13504:27-695(-)